MKKLLLFYLLAVFQPIFAQITFEPYENHGLTPYTATISGSGTIYYTTDGTDPTINSPSGVNIVNVTIIQNTVLKAKIGNSAIFTRTFYYGPLPQQTVYFKPPSTWTTACVLPMRIDPSTMVDYLHGLPMTDANCEGWYKYTYGYYKSGFVFDNCRFSYLDPLYQSTPYLETENTLFYDFSAGLISNPPACLLAVNDPTKKITVVKIFPNPVQDYINIESDKNFTAYEVIDQSGKTISKNNWEGDKIDISSLAAGVYFIKLKVLGNETYIVKFIKK